MAWKVRGRGRIASAGCHGQPPRQGKQVIALGGHRLSGGTGRLCWERNPYIPNPVLRIPRRTYRNRERHFALTSKPRPGEAFVDWNSR